MWATEAFSNETLSIEGRILATKLRVISRILESLEWPDAETDACNLYIKELHDLPFVKGMRSVYLKDEMKSSFSKSKLFERVMSVTTINLVLFDFASKFTKYVTTNNINWPIIWHGEETYSIIQWLKTVRLWRIWSSLEDLIQWIIYWMLMIAVPHRWTANEKLLHEMIPREIDKGSQHNYKWMALVLYTYGWKDRT